ncbi:MAG: hypothetical protein ACC726_07965 [Chloroflexota bacterium]
MRAAHPARLSRRRFLAGLAVVAGLAVMPARVVGAVLERALPLSAPAARRPETVAGLDGVDAVGLVYLHQVPDEASSSALREALGMGPNDDPRARPKRLGRRVARDFERGDVVVIDGWRLARSEARWAALIRLERRREGRD